MKHNLKVSLRALIILPFVILVTLAVGLTGYLSFMNGKKAVGEQSAQLRKELTLRVKDRIKDLTGQLHTLNQTLANDFDLGLLTAGDAAKLRRIFLNKLFQFKEVSMEAIGTEDGSDYGLSRNAEGEFLWFESDASTNYSLNNYNVDSQGDVVSFFSATPNYDPRTRPWYTAAKAAGKPVWSKI
jgi:hypothetical protein